jgi:hypothetical protein
VAETRPHVSDSPTRVSPDTASFAFPSGSATRWGVGVGPANEPVDYL